MVDLVRTRRRGVPRYNDFRAGLHKPRLQHWEELCDDQESVRRMRELYRSIDEVDTMVGLFAETPPDGFGFSDTAFRIFILMASRRLQSDRFLTVDFRPEIYSPFGMDWIAQQRHDQRHPAALPGPRRVLPRDGERVRAVAAGRASAGRAADQEAPRGAQDNDRTDDQAGPRRPRRPGRAAAAHVDLAAPHAPGEPRQLDRGRLDELDLDGAARRR